MEKKMTLWGVGPRFALLSGLYFLLTLAAHRLFYPLFRIECVPYTVLAALGVVLLAVGVPLWVGAAVVISRGFSADRLVTRGPYALCRHPLYGGAIFYSIPGILMFFQSWICLSLPPVMYVMARRLVAREEAYLRERFGQRFLDYAAAVNPLFPKIWRLRISGG